jgi:hypothetical protein
MNKRTSDFGEKNVLSYVYEKKEHKSLQMGKKNEYMINLMQDQFKTEDKLAVHEARTLKRDIDLINLKTDIDMEKRLKDRKVKEHEAKIFQDKQVA